MLSDIHFISGLPRSGSTLLSAILKQNPRFSATMSSPVAELLRAVMPKMSGGSEFGVFFDDARRKAVLRGLFDSYYGAGAAGKTVFDTNRTWTSRTALLNELYPQARIICCVRDIGWIIDSVERMLRHNPLQASRMFNFHSGSSVYARTDIMMNADSGLIGMAWSTLREGWFSEHANKLILLPYDRLVSEPAAVMKRLYEELKQPFFAHDFNHVAYDEPDYDGAVGMPGLHKVQQKVQPQKRTPCIPPDIFSKYADTQFWLKPEQNKRGVVIL